MCQWWWLVNHHWWQDGSKTSSSSFLLPAFFAFIFPFLKGFHLPGPFAKSRVWSFSFPFLEYPSEKWRSCTSLAKSKEQKEACERFPGPGSASAIRNCSLFSEGLLSDQQPITLRHAPAWQPGTTRCGPKVSLASSVCQVDRRRHCSITRTHTHNGRKKN